MKSDIRIGERIKDLRTQAHMTQSELAEGIVTRNMLSMIESGKTLASVDTLVALCHRLGVSPGLVFADQREELMYQKSAVIDKIRSCFHDRLFDEVISLSQDLAQDEEIVFFLTFAHLYKGMELFRTNPAEAVSYHFKVASELCEGCAYSVYVRNTVELANLLLIHAGERRVSEELCNFAGFSPCAFSGEIFSYLSAMRYIDAGLASSADAILKSGLLVSECYLFHVEGSVLDIEGHAEEALSAFVKAAQAVSGEFYSTLRLYTDIELCAQKLGDYKLAYDYSAKHIALIESIRK